MFFFKDYINNENEIVTYNKVKGRMFLNGFVLLMGLLMLPVTVFQIIDNIVNGRIDFEIINSYVVSIFGAFCLFISGSFFLSYFFNKLAISNKHIIIRKGTLGKLYIIPKSLILAKLPVYTYTRGIHNYQILLFLKNGKRINTGLLHCKSNEFQSINNRLKFRQIRRKKEIKSEFSRDITDEITIKRNIIFPIITFLPLVIIIITVWLLSSGFNYNYGIQTNFVLNGTVIEKQIEKNKGNTNLKLIVSDGENNTTHKIDVSSNVYEYFAKDQKITIKGKKGSLGLLYDVIFYSS